MFRHILLSTAAVAALTTASFAADLPTRKAPAPYVPAPVFTWAGFYVGGQLGYSWDSDRTTEFVTATGAATGFTRAFSPKGVVGGAHVGYNIQSGSFVYGLEADLEAAGISAPRYVNVIGSGTEGKLNFQGSLRGRVGYSFGNVLLYTTGGIAFANIKETYFTGGGVRESFSGTKAGWTLGAGIEYAINNNWSVRAEYRYTDFGNWRNNSLVVFPGFTDRNQQREQTVRIGVTYRFGGSAGPVVARY